MAEKKSVISARESMAVTILRVVAMLYVSILLHYLKAYTSSSAVNGIGEVFGFMGVGTFFAISGWLFGRKTEHTEKELSRREILGWYKKRMCRIMIPYWLILLTVICIRLIKSESVTLAVIVTHALNGQGMVKLYWAFPELGHTWFLSILMLCYLLTPFLIKLQKRRKLSVFFGGVITCLVLFFAWRGDLTYAADANYVLLYCIMFHLGGVSEENEFFTARPRLMLGILFLALCICFRVAGKVLWDDTSLYIVIVEGTIMCETILYFYAAKHMAVVERLSEMPHSRIVKWIKCLDEISYEYYLIHALFVSGSMSLRGILGGGLIEIFFLFCFSCILAYGLHKVLVRKGL